MTIGVLARVTYQADGSALPFMAGFAKASALYIVWYCVLRESMTTSVFAKVTYQANGSALPFVVGFAEA